MSGIAEKVLKQLTCPVCLAHPEKEVYQCLHGHPICSSCILRLKNCPQCQISFEIPRARCRLMESLLDSLKLPCKNKNEGCTLRLLQEKLVAHEKICEFRSVDFCKWLGFECDFKASKAGPLIKHLELIHNAQKLTVVVWKCASLSTTPAPWSIYFQQCASSSFKDSWIVLVVRPMKGPNKQTLFAWVPIHLIDGDCARECSIQFSSWKNVLDQHRLFKWTGTPLNYKDAEGYILNPPFQTTTDYITKYGVRDVTFQFSVNEFFSFAAMPVLGIAAM